MHASNGILFNHESPIRGETFVTRKITRAVARIEAGLEDCLYLGNLDAQRDWGHAKDYVRGMWMIVQAEQADDFVLATGVTRTVREFVELAFSELGRKIEWRGTGIEETGVDVKTGRTVVCIDPRYFRPTEVELLIGDPAKAREHLGWEPEISFAELIREMVSTSRWDDRSLTIHPLIRFPNQHIWLLIRTGRIHGHADAGSHFGDTLRQREGKG